MAYYSECLGENYTASTVVEIPAEKFQPFKLAWNSIAMNVNLNDDELQVSSTLTWSWSE